MIRLATAFIFALWAAPGASETVQVLSGEHEGFTRLALVLEEPSDWAFGRSRDGYELRLAREGVTYDLAEVYNRVDRDRLADLAVSQDGHLWLSVADGNRPIVFELRTGVLVIDIRTGPPVPGSQFERVLPGTRPAVPPQPRTAALVRALSAAGRLPLPPPDAFWPTDVPAQHAAQPPRIEAAAPNGQTEEGPVEPDPQSARIATAQDLLLEQIARGASQGLLDAAYPTLPTVPAPSLAPADEISPPPPDSAQLEESAAPAALNQINVQVETSIDRDGLSIVRHALTQSGNTCPKVPELDVASWADDAAPADLIATRRLPVLGEFDRAGNDAVAELARAYLFIGFGAEAAATLRAFSVPVEGSDLLFALAEIMDGDVPAPDSRLRTMAACDGPAALWALLAHSPNESVPDLDTPSVVRSFSALPAHLRRNLGTAVSDRLVGLGQLDAATSVRDATSRAFGGPGVGTELISARLSEAAGALPESEDALLRVVAGDGSQAPAALQRYVDGRLAQGLPVSRGIAESAGALAFEHRSAPDGLDLARTEILSLAASGAFAEGFAALQRLQDRRADDTEIDSDQLAQITGPFFKMMAEEAPDPDFLRMVFDAATGPGGTPHMPPDAAAAVAGRLLALGFAAEARVIWTASDSQDPTTPVFLARAALAERDGRAALVALAGLDGFDAAELRGEAFSLIGDHAGAAEAYAEAGARPDEARAAWAAGDWARFAALGDGRRVDVLRSLVLSPAAPLAEPTVDTGATDTANDAPPALSVTGASSIPEGVLAQNRTLLEQSQEDRAAIAELRDSLIPAPGFDVPRNP